MACSSNLTMMQQYSIEPRTKKYVEGYWVLSFARNYKKQLLYTGLDSLKTTSKTGKFVQKKIADAVTKSNNNKIVKQEPVEEIIIPPEKKRWNIKQTEKIIIKMEHYKKSKLLNSSTVLKSVTEKCIEKYDLSSSQYSVNKKY